MRRVMLVVAAGVVAAACTLVQEAQSHTVMISELITTPPESVAGVSISGKVVATVYLLTVDPSNPQTGTPITDAQVNLEFDGQIIPLASADGGGYYVDSIQNPQVTYTAGDNYRFTAASGGQQFAQDVLAPEQEIITEFHTGLTPYTTLLFGDGGLLGSFDAGGFQLADGGAIVFPDAGAFQIPDAGFSLQNLNFADGGIPGFVPISPGSTLTLHREDAVNGTATTAVTVVIPLDSNFEPQSPSFSSPATNLTGVLSLIFAPSVYQTPTITIDGTQAWPQCPPTDYVIAVTGLATGSNEGSNLFPASSAFAGSADAAPAHCLQ